MTDLFDGADFDLFDDKSDEKLAFAPVQQTVESKSVKTKLKRTLTRRAFSEENLYRIMDWHIECGDVFNIITTGDIDFLTFVRSVLKQQKAKCMILSTWAFGNEDAEEILTWVKKGLIERLDVYVGEIIKTYSTAAETLKEATSLTGGRLALFRNHAKCAAIFGERFNVAISSSANINTNPRAEQTVIQADDAVCAFYKENFDKIIAFNKEDQPADWRPWNDTQR